MNNNQSTDQKTTTNEPSSAISLPTLLLTHDLIGELIGMSGVTVRRVAEVNGIDPTHIHGGRRWPLYTFKQAGEIVERIPRKPGWLKKEAFIAHVERRLNLTHGQDFTV